MRIMESIFVTWLTPLAMACIALWFGLFISSPRAQAIISNSNNEDNLIIGYKTNEVRLN